MIRLPYTGTYSLELVTAQNGAQVAVFYSDDSSSGYPGGVQVTTISSATTTTICATPAASTVRDIDYINIKNTYAGSHTITVQLDVSSTNYPLQTVVLLENESYNYTHGSGWQAKDANGNTKASALTAMTSAQLAALLSDETGSGAAVFATSPAFVTSVTGSVSMDVFNTMSTTVNAFGAATALSLGAATGTLTLNNPAVSFKAGAVGAPSIYLDGDTTSGLYRIAANEIGVSISGVERGHWSSTGLGVTGAITGTATGNWLSNTGATTNRKWMQMDNTGGSVLFGINNSTGSSIFTGDAAYSASFGTGNSTDFNFATNNIVRAILSGATGLFNTKYGIQDSHPTSGIGYATGAGGTVAQGAGSGKATGVTLAKVCGTITMDGASLAADTTVTFLLTMTGFTLNATDQLILSHKAVGTFGAYNLNARYASATTMNIDVHNTTPGALAEAIVIQYSLFRSVAA